MRLWEIIDNAAAAEPGGTALVAGTERRTFGELASDIASLGTALSTMVSPGDRVAVVADNRPAYVTALYAVPRASAALVHGNTRHTAAELAEMMQRCKARVLIGTAEQLDRLAAEDLPSVHARICMDDRSAGATAISELTATAQSDPPNPDESTMAWLLYTSGTTGRAKGAMLTHRSLISAALNTTMARPVAEDEVYLFPFPLFHVAAYNVIHHHLRRRPVVLAPRFEPEAVMASIEAERVTSVSLAPTMLAMLLDHSRRSDFDLSSLRTVSYGAAAMPLTVMRRSLAELPGVGLAQGYGMTELSGNAVFLSPEDHRRAATDDPDLLTAAGRPGPLCSLRIVDDKGAEVPPGDSGEILVRGDQVCAGYFDDPATTATAIVGGWLHTGDLGRVDHRGYLHIVDRKKDIIITGGENVSSREVEDAVGTHELVGSAAVVGVADERWGELVVVVVAPRPEQGELTLDDVRRSCTGLAGFKHPRALVLTDELPTNASGKVDKVAVRALVETELGAHEPPTNT